MSPRPPAPRLSALDASPALVERTYRALLDAIVAGELAPGERHTQEALAERLDAWRAKQTASVAERPSDDA